MSLSRWRNISIFGFPVCLSLIFLLAACGGTPVVQTKPTPTPTLTVSSGQQLLSTVATRLNSAKTLHGIFDLSINGQTVNGMINTEVWNATAAKSRTEVLQSNVAQFSAPGSITVTDGKTLWQYDPTKKIVYTGPAPTNAAGSPNGQTGASGGGSRFLLTLLQTVFTRSDGTLQADTTVHGKSVYDVAVTAQAQTTATGTATGTVATGTPAATGTANADAGPGSFAYNGDVYIDKSTRLPVQMNLTLQGFGKVLLDIPMLDINPTLPESTFTFTAPPGTKVLPLQAATSGPTSGSLSLAQAEQQAGYHLLSIPSSQSAYALQGVNALGSPGNQIYTLTYTQGSASFTIAEGKALANLPGTGQQVTVRGTTGTLESANGATTLAWTEKGVGIRITGTVSSDTIQQIAALLS